jgi:hypothetical protein
LAWNAEISQPLWSTIPRANGYNDDYGAQLQSPVIGDLDGNGSLEIVVANAYGIAILDGTNGAHLSCQQSHCGSLLSLQSGGMLKSTPMIEDLNNDGINDLILAGSLNSQGIVHTWSYFNAHSLSLAGASLPYSRAWPAFRGNSRRDGNSAAGL